MVSTQDNSESLTMLEPVTTTASMVVLIQAITVPFTSLLKRLFQKAKRTVQMVPQWFAINSSIEEHVSSMICFYFKIYFYNHINCLKEFGFKFILLTFTPTLVLLLKHQRSCAKVQIADLLKCAFAKDDNSIKILVQSSLFAARR